MRTALTHGRRDARAPFVIASSNPGKLVEIRAILASSSIELCGLDEFPDVTLPEEGDDYERNAAQKAETVARVLGRHALADDSGLEVVGLGGGPGPLSARYGGPALDDAGRVEHLLSQLAGRRGEQRDARFVCVASLASPQGELFTARGECEGRILESPRGEGGFGYDPIFEVAASGRSMAELPAAEKNRISHRARAFVRLVAAAGY